ncbi:MAG TPA: hypothetical protein VFC56_16450 [Stellaceae bacterium]|nr:hypothetical protein [Stellaceae bacterium]
MNARTLRRTRTNGWQSSIAASSALTSSISTDDPSLSLVTAPTPTLVIRFGGGSGAPFVVVPGAGPAQPRLDQPQEPGSGEAEENSPPVWGQAPEPAPAAPEGKPEVLLDRSERPIWAESRVTLEPAPDRRQEPHPPEPEEKAAPDSNRIELIIDSLPNHALSEPIPVTIVPLGDSMFTASMRDLDIAATGNSIGEALLFLKEQIDTMFEDLNRRLSHLTFDQKATLQMLQTYIASSGTKSRWF